MNNMIIYKDTTFCCSDVPEHTCERELTKEEEKEAKEMGSEIAWAEFCKEVNE